MPMKTLQRSDFEYIAGNLDPNPIALEIIAEEGTVRLVIQAEHDGDGDAPGRHLINEWAESFAERHGYWINKKGFRFSDSSAICFLTAK